MEHDRISEIEQAVLPLVSKPGRYHGRFLNQPAPKMGDADVRFLLAVPDSFEIGMSHQGIRMLYHILNSLDFAQAEFSFAPWPDMERLMRERGLPLFSFESLRPAREFDVVGFSLSYELHYTNVLNMLDLAAVPLRSSARGPEDPIIIAGGACCANPEPMAEFIDCFVIGDGEDAVVELAGALREAKQNGLDRGRILEKLRELAGVYVPACHREGARREGGGQVGAVARGEQRGGAPGGQLTETQRHAPAPQGRHRRPSRRHRTRSAVG